MWKNILALFLFIAAFVLAAANAHAQQGDSALPTVSVMPCQAKCAAHTPPKAISTIIPTFPQKEANAFVESFIEIRMLISTDGKAHSARLEHLIGPQIFGDLALDAVSNWKFEPATSNGIPVDEEVTLPFFFQLDSPTGARLTFFDNYNSATQLIRNDNADKAYQKLHDMFFEPSLTLYERGMAANLLASLQLTRGDYFGTQMTAKLAYEFGQKILPSTVAQNLLKLELEADLASGDIGGGLSTLFQLQKDKSFDEKDSVVALTENAREKVEAISELVTSMKIPDSDQQAFFGTEVNLDLYRQNFNFGAITGSLEKFEMRCDQATIESKITPTAVWHVPENWSGCALEIHGAPGTTFQVYQSKS